MIFPREIPAASSLESAALRHLGWIRLVHHGSRCALSTRLSGTHTGSVQELSPGEPGAGVLDEDQPQYQLEVRHRQLQRVVSHPHGAPAGATVDRPGPLDLPARDVAERPWPRQLQPMRPSMRDRLPDGTPHPFDALLRQWDIDPESYPDFETKAMQGWLDLKQQKRKLWRERGYLHYEHMNDEELTDSPHTVIFPNVTVSFLPDNVIFFRTEPHPDDPSRCTFDLWCMAFPVTDQTEVESIMAGVQPFREAEFEHRDFDGGRGVPEIEGQIVYQDMQLAEGQQRGLRSRGYTDSYLAGQETGVRFFHEVLNDYLEGRR